MVTILHLDDILCSRNLTLVPNCPPVFNRVRLRLRFEVICFVLMENSRMLPRNYLQLCKQRNSWSTLANVTMAFLQHFSNRVLIKVFGSKIGYV